MLVPAAGRSRAPSLRSVLAGCAFYTKIFANPSFLTNTFFFIISLFRIPVKTFIFSLYPPEGLAPHPFSGYNVIENAAMSAKKVNTLDEIEKH